MPYLSDKYEFLFDRSADQMGEDELRKLMEAHRGGMFYRTRVITAGDCVEVETYPVWNTRSEIRKAREYSSSEAQKSLNEQNAKRKLARKINANFTSDDLHVTLTYRGGIVPDMKQARADMRRYLRRVREWRKASGLSPLKYIYVIEFGSGDRRRKRVHFHVIMSGMDRAVAKSLWEHGMVRADELQPEDGSLEGLARYITKEPHDSKRWACSQNLISVTRESSSDTKISRRRALEMARDFEDAPRAILEHILPECVLDDCTVKSSGFVAGIYIRAKMHKKTSQGGSGEYGTDQRKRNGVPCGKDNRRHELQGEVRGGG